MNCNEISSYTYQEVSFKSNVYNDKYTNISLY